jgi:hypothetical protein
MRTHTLRAGEDLALLLTASDNSASLTQYRNHSMFPGRFVTELVRSLVQREELKPSSESGRFVAAQSHVPSVSAPEMEVSE